MASRLADLYSSCHDAFQALLSAVRAPKRDVGDQMPPRDIESELDKFILWADNVGAIHSGDSYEMSLDYRLRKSPFYQDRVSSFLNSLNEYIVQDEAKPFEELVYADLGVDPNEITIDSDTDSDSDSDNSEEEDEKQYKRHSGGTDKFASTGSNDLELPKTLELIRFIINCLYKMPIRRPAALERITERISARFEPYQQYDAQFVQDLHPELDPTIAARLGRLVSLRRQILAYQERHNQKLQPEPTQRGLSSKPIVHAKPEAEAAVYTIAPSEQVSGISRPSKATTHQNPSDRPELQNFDYPPSIASSHHSRASSYAINSIGLPIPPIPKNADGTPLINFLCPYCRIIQHIKSQRSWKKHVLHDLQPYVCTFSGCSSQDHFFSSRNAWYMHETQEHRCVWHCNVEGHDIYDTKELFIGHMSQSHGTKLSAEQMTNLAPMFRRTDRRFSGKCNLCFRKSKSLCDHVARHLERIALFALPRSLDGDVDSTTSQDQRSLEALLSDNESLSASRKYQSSDEDSGLESTSPASGTNAGPAPGLFEDGEQLSEVSEDLIPDSEDANWDVITTKFSQAQNNDTVPDASPESLLSRFFPDSLSQIEGMRFTEKDICEIEALLYQCSQDAWGRIPRIYTVLRIIERLDTIEAFIEEQISDTWFPFTKDDLQRVLPGKSAQVRFLEVQRVVFNNSRALGVSTEAEHCHFSDENDIALEPLRMLDTFRATIVEHVSSTITRKEYIRKFVPRGGAFRSRKNHMDSFARELRTMKLASGAHCHMLQLVGSYTDPFNMGIIMSPAADQTLTDFLDGTDTQFSTDTIATEPFDGLRRLLFSYFGCLVAAIGFLHNKYIRHKDIRPGNILISDREVFISGFGLSPDWSDSDSDDPEGRPNALTRRYSAPEVIKGKSHDFESDIWSLGCVYLEMWTMLRGGSMADLNAHMGEESSYSSREFDLEAWITLVDANPSQSSDSSSSDTPLTWIRSMLQRNPTQRPTARAIHSMIQKASTSPRAGDMFIGHCCISKNAETESATSSDEDDHQDG